MSEEEKYNLIIQEIKDIYLYLTEGEPTPDDEITAREKLIKQIQTLKTIKSFSVEANIPLFDDTLNKLENWDTRIIENRIILIGNSILELSLVSAVCLVSSKKIYEVNKNSKLNKQKRDIFWGKLIIALTTKKKIKSVITKEPENIDEFFHYLKENMFNEQFSTMYNKYPKFLNQISYENINPSYRQIHQKTYILLEDHSRAV